MCIRIHASSWNKGLLIFYRVKGGGGWRDLIDSQCNLWWPLTGLSEIFSAGLFLLKPNFFACLPLPVLNFIVVLPKKKNETTTLWDLFNTSCYILILYYLWVTKKKRIEYIGFWFAPTGTNKVNKQNLDQCQYLGKCPPTPPQPNINLNLLSIDCCWVWGGVGGQLSRYWYWSQNLMKH